ncbi:MAG: hypothetical protein FWF33_01905 [Clostridiales bacterium]|nr:hypothetical protein [Clostridiales bacterium]
MPGYEEQFKERDARVKKAIRLEQADRVPFVPYMGSFYALRYDGVTMYEAMKDLTSMIPPMERFLEQYDPDLLYAPSFYPIDVMEQAGAKNLRWPGPYWDMPLDAPYQYLDECFLQDDEWDEYLKDPTRFLLRKVLPKKYGAFEGLENLSIYALVAQAPVSLSAAAAPGVKEALENLLKIGETAANAAREKAKISLRAIELGYPVYATAVATSPFDEFADCIRGLMPTLMDLCENPLRLNEAVERWAEISIPAKVGQAEAMHAQYALVPLHCGLDEFMSPENYDKYYWPQLKRMLLALIAKDITPFVLCEGHYDTRLDTISDITPGKVIYLFEKVDMALAKQKLGKTACIAGNLDTSLLISGTVDEVVKATKKLIDTCAPGGGYLMSNSLAIDNARHDLIEAWRETTLAYGVY